MKKLLLYFFLFFAVFSNAQQERILQFDSQIKIDSSAIIQVEENIKVHAEGLNIKRGIYRVLPTIRKKNNGSFPVNYNIEYVTKNGEEEDFHVKEENGLLYIYIGNKNNYLSPGDYDYTIRYTADNQIGYFEDFDELYWNVNGNYWDFPIDEISATIILPSSAQLKSKACYTGSYGSKDSNCYSEEVANDNIIYFSAKDFAPSENLTIAVAFDKGFVAYPPEPNSLEKYGLIILSIILFFLLVWYCYASWDKYGRDYAKPTPYPQFEVPNNLSPGGIGFYNYLGACQKFFTASIVNLAVKGYLRIEEVKTKTFFSTKTKFKLHQLKEPDDDLPNEEEGIMRNLFKSDSVKEIGDEYDEDIQEAVSDYKASLNAQFEYEINKGSNLKFLIIPIILVFGLDILNIYVTLFMIPYTPILEDIVFLWCFSFVVGLIALIIPSNTKVFNVVMIEYILISLIYIGFAVITHVVTTEGEFYSVTIPHIIFSVMFSILLFYRILIKKPSLELVETQSLIDGFEMYLTYAEEKQLQHFNPPKLTPEVFEKMLPYAITLGIDEIWGDKFQNLIEKGMTTQNYSPSWYMGDFYTMNLLTDSLSNTMSKQVSTAATPPYSSGSSESGSSGDGFSGGGGGGGGGGGW